MSRPTGGECASEGTYNVMSVTFELGTETGDAEGDGKEVDSVAGPCKPTVVFSVRVVGASQEICAISHYWARGRGGVPRKEETYPDQKCPHWIHVKVPRTSRRGRPSARFSRRGTRLRRKEGAIVRRGERREGRSGLD